MGSGDLTMDVSIENTTSVFDTIIDSRNETKLRNLVNNFNFEIMGSKVLIN